MFNEDYHRQNDLSISLAELCEYSRRYTMSPSSRGSGERNLDICRAIRCGVTIDLLRVVQMYEVQY